MGLDQYAYARTPGSYNEEDDGWDADGIEIAYWRKHNRLQGWMADLWHSRGNTGMFNGQALELDSYDLDALEKDIRARALPATGGFFFGSDSYGYYDDDMEAHDLAFIQEAREHLAEGRTVVYVCSW
jgi:hypothetical protein